MRSRGQDRTDTGAMWLITLAISDRMPCPSNDKIAAAIGARGAAAGAAALRRLEAKGIITIERANGWRIVRETEYGRKTEGPDE